MATKTFRPKKDYEGARLTLSLPDRAEDLSVDEWPYETEDVAEQAALEAHPWITDRPPVDSGDSPGGASTRTTSKKEGK